MPVKENSFLTQTFTYHESQTVYIAHMKKNPKTQNQTKKPPPNQNPP